MIRKGSSSHDDGCRFAGRMLTSRDRTISPKCVVGRKGTKQAPSGLEIENSNEGADILYAGWRRIARMALGSMKLQKKSEMP